MSYVVQPRITNVRINWRTVLILQAAAHFLNTQQLQTLIVLLSYYWQCVLYTYKLDIIIIY